MPGLPFRWATDVPNEFANGDALTLILVHLELSGAPEVDKSLRNRYTSTVASLQVLIYNRPSEIQKPA